MGHSSDEGQIQTLERPRMMPAKSQPDFTGLWELSFQKSILLGPAPERTRMIIDHREPILVQQIIVILAGGSEQQMTFTYEIGAETTNSIGNAVAQTRAWWHEAELVIESRMNLPSRMAYFKDHWSLSENGQTLTMAHREDDLAGQISVLERQIPAKKTGLAR